MRLLVSLFTVVVLLLSSVTAQEDVVAELFGQPVTLADLSPDAKTLSQFARMNAASCDGLV